MTKHYEVTKMIRKIMKGEAKSNGVVFCIGDSCNQVKYDKSWIVYRNLQGIEKHCLSSGICPKCEFKWREDFERRRNE
jgi:hypothetical protein